MDVIARVNELLQKGETVCLMTVLASNRSAIPAGSKAIVRTDGSMRGGFSAELGHGQVRDLALRAIKEKKHRMLDVKDGLRLFFNVLSAEAKLLVCGAGHIAIPLVRIAKQVGFQVTVLDDRSDFARLSRFPDCKVIVENFTIALKDMPLGLSTFAVIITRGHEHDVDCLTEILPKETAYVGLIGSRRRVSFVLQWLEEKGFSRERLKDVFTPIGIPIGAESPEEIALSIVSELVCVRRKGGDQARSLRSAVGIEL